jgi:pilus assembly protein CpaF
VAITEVQRMESDVITLQDLFTFKLEGFASDRRVIGGLVSTGLRPGFIEKFEKRGIKLPSWLSNPSPPPRKGARPAREIAA